MAERRPCGCRPADTFCKAARRMQANVRDCIDALDLANSACPSNPERVMDAKQDLAAAERALRDHLAMGAAAPAD